jgi:RimJ/RimL family protein N-acetyltransferase
MAERSYANRAPEEFRTSRLRGVRFSEHHFAELRTLDADQRIQKTLFGAPYSEADTHARCEKRVAHWDTYGFGDYLMYTLDGPFIGSCSLFFSRIEVAGAVEVGYVLRPEFWGRGYATEMTGAVLAIGFEALHLKRIYAATTADNLPSRRVMEKCGMTFLRDYLYNERWPSVLYGIEKP